MPICDFDVTLHQRGDCANPIGGLSAGSCACNFIFLPWERADVARRMAGASKRAH